jgi:type I restriction enzyme, S subunit
VATFRHPTPKTDRYERGFLLKDPENNQFLVVHPGDFVFNPMNLRFGAISYSKASFPVLVSAYYNILKPKLNKCDPDFMEAFLRSHEVMNLYDRIAIGSLIEKRRVHLSILNRTFIAIPPLKEQTVIGEKLKTWDRARVSKSAKLS